MPNFQSVAIFCEDIREEIGDQVSLVGLFPDNIDVPSQPGSSIPIVPKLGLYVRTVFDPKAINEGTVTISLVAPEGDLIFSNDVDLADHAGDIEDALQHGYPMFTLVTRALMPRFPLSQWGEFQVWTQWKEERVLSGLIRFREVLSDAAGVSTPN